MQLAFVRGHCGSPPPHAGPGARGGAAGSRCRSTIAVGRADILDVTGILDPTRLIRSGRLLSYRLFPVFGYIASRLARSAPLSGKYRGGEDAKTPGRHGAGRPHIRLAGSLL